MQFSTNNTLFIGKNLITLKQVDSTNNYAKLLTNSGPVPEGTVILAEEQYGGRGQAGNSWQSDPAKNLTFSIILACDFLPPSDQFFLSMAVSLGMLEGAGPLLKDNCCIKWPNDIYSGRKKLGGLLIENILSGSRLKTSIAGIGINVNQDHFPDLPRATSLKKEAGRGFSLDRVFTALCAGIEARFLQLKGGARGALKEDYLRHLLGYRQRRQFRLPFSASAFEGIITGITPEGRLLVETADGQKAFDKKEISFVF